MMRPESSRRRATGPRRLRAAWTVLAVATLAATIGCGAPVRRPPVSVDAPPPLATAPDPPSAVEESASADAVAVFHRVLPGQTAWRIARAYGIPMTVLVDANGLDDPTRIAAGDLLRIPGADRSIHVPPHPEPPTPVPLPSPPTGDVTPPPGFGPDGLLPPVDRAFVVSRYGSPRGGRRHAGIDFDGERGDPIVAAADGVVTYAGSGMAGYGRTVVLDHGDGWTTLYAHASELVVRVGDRVRRGDTIARVGRSGNATGSHCHFELRRDGRPVDPSGHFGRGIASRTP